MNSKNKAAQDELGFSMPRHVLAPLAVLLLVVLLALWGGFSYSGLLARMAEWQFAYLGEWYPAITVLSFSALAVMVWRLPAIIRKLYRKRNGQWSERDEREHRVRLSRKSYSALLIMSGFSAVMALIGFIYWLGLPGMDNRPASLSASNPAYLQEGAVSFKGLSPVGPTARYREAIFNIGPSQYFAPVAARRTRNGEAEYYLFAELSWFGKKLRIDDKRTGILRRAALPGELVALYRNNGHAVADKPSVVFLSEHSSGRASLVFIVEALALGLITLVFGLVMRRIFHRTLDDFRREYGPGSQIAP